MCACSPLGTGASRDTVAPGVSDPRGRGSGPFPRLQGSRGLWLRLVAPPWPCRASALSCGDNLPDIKNPSRGWSWGTWRAGGQWQRGLKVRVPAASCFSSSGKWVEQGPTATSQVILAPGPPARAPPLAVSPERGGHTCLAHFVTRARSRHDEHKHPSAGPPRRSRVQERPCLAVPRGLSFSTVNWV